MLRIQIPQIGTITGIDDDGSYRQGPIPGIGGPFETATDFFKAWSTRVEFGMSHDQLKAATGTFADELSASALKFKVLVNELAENLSVRNNGPFPLRHGDIGHNNMVFDDKYRLLGVIDWETAFAAPWEIACEFPSTLSVVTPAMDVPWNYDATGQPNDPDDIQMLLDQENCMEMVMRKVSERVLGEECDLFLALQDSK